MKGTAGLIAHRLLVIVLPTIAATLGAAVLAYDANLFASFCGAA